MLQKKNTNAIKKKKKDKYRCKMKILIHKLSCVNLTKCDKQKLSIILNVKKK